MGRRWLIVIPLVLMLTVIAGHPGYATTTKLLGAFPHAQDDFDEYMRYARAGDAWQGKKNAFALTFSSWVPGSVSADFDATSGRVYRV